MNVYFCGCGEWSGLVSMILKLEMRTSMIELRLEISLWGFLSGNARGAGECVRQIAGFEECCPGGLLRAGPWLSVVGREQIVVDVS